MSSTREDRLSMGYYTIYEETTHSKQKIQDDKVRQNVTCKNIYLKHVCTHQKHYI